MIQAILIKDFTYDGHKKVILRGTIIEIKRFGDDYYASVGGNYRAFISNDKFKIIE